MRHRDLLVAACEHQSLLYDKSLLTVAGGALGLSITFIQNIAPDPVEGSRTYLALAWIALTVSIGATLFSIYASQWACHRAIDCLDEEQCAEGSAVPMRNYWATATKSLNAVSAAAFLAGVGLLATFTFLNLNT